MRWLALLPIVYVAAVIDTSLADALRIGRVEPNLLALVAVVCVAASRWPWAFLAGGLVALAGDLIAPGRLGVGTAWMLAAGYGIGLLGQRVRLDSLPMRLAVTWAAVSGWAVGVALTGWLLGDVPGPLGSILAGALGTGLYTAALALPVWMVIGWLQEPTATARMVQTQGAS